jgi:hypothetical protein
MKNTIFASVAALFVATTAYAEGSTAATTRPQLGGSINVEVTENAAGDYVATTTLGAGINVEGLAFASATIESVDGATFEIDEWNIGTQIGVATLSFGKQGDLMVGNDFEIVGGDTLADVADDHESLQVTVGAASVMVGLTDITTDVTDVENVQGAYTIGAITAVGDYNIDSEEWVLGAKASYDLNEDVALGGILTYSSATEAFGFEASAGYSIATVFVNGDDADMFQNIGAGVSYDVQSNLNVYAEGAYNIDAEDTVLGAGVSFSF